MSHSRHKFNIVTVSQANITRFSIDISTSKKICLIVSPNQRKNRVPFVGISRLLRQCRTRGMKIRAAASKFCLSRTNKSVLHRPHSNALLSNAAKQWSNLTV
eukprot:Lithocolla_globosa_v1_NODE_966_length_3014_cov_12.896249.p5 type:complete len:102 gc:universal NODE_966_length_3014_cov_12.896249:1208-1513(+)